MLHAEAAPALASRVMRATRPMRTFFRIVSLLRSTGWSHGSNVSTVATSLYPKGVRLKDCQMIPRVLARITS